MSGHIENTLWEEIQRLRVNLDKTPGGFVLSPKDVDWLVDECRGKSPHGSNEKNPSFSQVQFMGIPIKKNPLMPEGFAAVVNSKREVLYTFRIYK